MDKLYHRAQHLDIIRSKGSIEFFFVLMIDVIFFFFYRKGGLLLNSFVGIAGGCLMGSTKFFRSYEMLFLGRFIIGINCGKCGESGVSSAYLEYLECWLKIGSPIMPAV